MSFQGHIENGLVVLDEPLPLPNGTIVRVEPVEASRGKVDAWGQVVADTDQPRTMQQMAQAWKAVAKPIKSLKRGPITVAVRDRQGTVTRIERTIEVGVAK